MKHLHLIIALFSGIFLVCCQNKKMVNTDLKSIYLEERTRGTSRTVEITSKEVVATNNDNTKKITLTESDWKAISAIVNKLTLDKVSTYKAPSTGRYSDRNLIAKIKIVSGKNEFYSQDFDSGNPPKELAELYQKLTSYLKKTKVSTTSRPNF